MNLKSIRNQIIIRAILGLILFIVACYLLFTRLSWQSGLSVLLFVWVNNIAYWIFKGQHDELDKSNLNSMKEVRDSIERLLDDRDRLINK